MTNHSHFKYEVILIQMLLLFVCVYIVCRSLLEKKKKGLKKDKIEQWLNVLSILCKRRDDF